MFTFLASHQPPQEWLSWIRTLPAGKISFLHSKVSPRLLNMPRGTSEERLSAAWHAKSWRLASDVSLASAQIQLLCRCALLHSSSSSRAAAAAAAAHCAHANLALLPTVLLSALKQSPFGTAGCHGTSSIPSHRNGAGARRVNCVTGDVGPWESSVWSFESKNTESIFRRQGGAGGGWRLAYFSLFFFFFLKPELGALTEPPRERQEWRECSEVVQKRKSCVLNPHAGYFASLVWKRFASYSQGKKAQRGSSSSAGVESLLWIKSILFHKYGTVMVWDSVLWDTIFTLLLSWTSTKILIHSFLHPALSWNSFLFFWNVIILRKQKSL